MFHDGDLADGNEDRTLHAPFKPERVLVFTTVSLLSLLTIASHAHIDGTFKVSYCILIEINIHFKLSVHESSVDTALCHDS